MIGKGVERKMGRESKRRKGKGKKVYFAVKSIDTYIQIVHLR